MRIAVLALVSALVLLGCAAPETYPLSDQECGPDDPVKELDASDCLTPTR